MNIIDLPIKSIKPYKRNPRKNDSAVEYVANSIRQFGFKVPIVIDENYEIVCGHTRWKAAKTIGLETVPCIMADDLNEEQIKAFRLADNKTAEMAGWDFDLLELEFNDIDPDLFDMSDFGFFQDDEKVENTSRLEHDNAGALQKRFIIAPFSVLDTKTGAWQERKKQWREILGNLSETRDGEDQIIGKGLNSLTYKQEEFTSNFDPVLAEIMYYWFCPDGGNVLDPFGGEQTKGIVAGEMGLSYSGVEIRQEQVDLNTRLTEKYPNVRYYCGDSNNISEILEGQSFDFCFTSPPYYDLECYSKEDMSALGTYQEFLAQYKNIFQQCYELLDENTFCVVKVGEIRDKKTGEYRSFVPDTVKILQSIGFIYYNEIILANQLHIACMQCNNLMRNRKVAHVHQNVLVFYKGNLKKIQEKLPPIEYHDEDFDE